MLFIKQKIVTVVLLSLTLSLTGCSLQDKEDQAFIENTKKKVRTQLKKGKDVVNLGDLAGEEWDKLYLFDPYTSKEEIEKTIGFPYEESTAIEMQDSINLLVFTKGKKVVNAIDFPLSEIYFFENERGLELQREQAIFKIVQTNDRIDLVGIKKGNCRLLEICKEFKTLKTKK